MCVFNSFYVVAFSDTFTGVPCDSEHELSAAGLLEVCGCTEADGQGPIAKRQENQPPLQSSGASCRKIFLGGLTRETTSEMLRSYFSTIAEVTVCDVRSATPEFWRSLRSLSILGSI